MTKIYTCPVRGPGYTPSETYWIIYNDKWRDEFILLVQSVGLEVLRRYIRELDEHPPHSVATGGISWWNGNAGTPVQDQIAEARGVLWSLPDEKPQVILQDPKPNLFHIDLLTQEDKPMESELTLDRLATAITSVRLLDLAEVDEISDHTLLKLEECLVAKLTEIKEFRGE